MDMVVLELTARREIQPGTHQSRRITRTEHGRISAGQLYGVPALSGRRAASSPSDIRGDRIALAPNSDPCAFEQLGQFATLFKVIEPNAEAANVQELVLQNGVIVFTVPHPAIRIEPVLVLPVS